jgi:hypothetical protein
MWVRAGKPLTRSATTTTLDDDVYVPNGKLRAVKLEPTYKITATVGAGETWDDGVTECTLGDDARKIVNIQGSNEILAFADFSTPKASQGRYLNPLPATGVEQTDFYILRPPHAKGCFDTRHMSSPRIHLKAQTAATTWSTSPTAYTESIVVYVDLNPLAAVAFEMARFQDASSTYHVVPVNTVGDVTRVWLIAGTGNYITQITTYGQDGASEWTTTDPKQLQQAYMDYKEAAAITAARYLIHRSHPWKWEKRTGGVRQVHVTDSTAETLKGWFVSAKAI